MNLIVISEGLLRLFSHLRSNAKRLPVSRTALRALSLDQLVELNDVVSQLIQDAKEVKKQVASKNREAAKEKARDNKTYPRIFTRCGKKNCKCAKDFVGHGPYWYAFWSEGGERNASILVRSSVK